MVGLKRKQGTAELSRFDATQGMRNDQLIVIKLLVLATSSLASWSIMACAAAMESLLCGHGQEWRRLTEDVAPILAEIPLYWWPAGVITVALLYFSSSALFIAFGLWLPGHHKTFARGIALASAVGYLAGWDAKHGWRFIALWSAAGWFLSALLATAFLLALWKAVKSGFLGTRLLAGATGFWAVSVAAVIGLLLKVVPHVPPIPPPALGLGAVLLALPLAATALAPLALASQRHQ